MTRTYSFETHVSVCEHCDGERNAFTRIDARRGWVCMDCDRILDKMLDEPPRPTAGSFPLARPGRRRPSRALEYHRFALAMRARR